MTICISCAMQTVSLLALESVMSNMCLDCVQYLNLAWDSSRLHCTGFFKGVGKGVVGAIAQPISGGLDFASSAFEGIDATKDQLIGRPRAGTTNRRLRLPRAIGGDGKVTAFICSDGSEKEVLPSFTFISSKLHESAVIQDSCSCLLWTLHVSTQLCMQVCCIKTGARSGAAFARDAILVTVSQVLALF